MVKKAHLAAILWIPTANPLHHNHNRYTEPLEINAQSLDGSQINLTTLAHLKSVKMAQQCNPRHFVMCVILILATIEENFPIWLSNDFAMILRKIYQSSEEKCLQMEELAKSTKTNYTWSRLQSPKLPLWCRAVRDVMAWPLQGLSTTPPLTAVLTWPLIRSYSSWWLCGTAVRISGKILLARRDRVMIMGDPVQCPPYTWPSTVRSSLMPIWL